MYITNVCTVKLYKSVKQKYLITLGLFAMKFDFTILF